MRPISHIAPSAHCHTASQLSVALRISKRNTLIALAEIQPAGTVFVQGNETSVWSFDLLPERFRETIVLNARQSNLSVADYLAAGLKTWQPETSLAEITESVLSDARCLRDALLPALDRLGQPMFDPAELVRLGLADYERVFGHAVSERHWQRLMNRTLLRDAGAKNFTRLEIYLPETPARKAVQPSSYQAAKDDLLLSDFISTFADPTNPTDKDVAALFGHIFDHSGVKTATKREWKQLRRALAKQLFTLLPALAASERALRVNLDRKCKRWLAGGGLCGALLDGQFLARYIARQFAKTEDSTLFLGDGTAAYGNITGIDTYCTTPVAGATPYLASLAAGKTVPSDVGLADLRNLRGLVNPAILANMAANGQTQAAYYFHPSFEPLLRSFNQYPNFVVFTNENGKPTFDGWPVRWIGVGQPFSTAAAPGQTLARFGDLSYWYLGERGEPRVEVSKEVFFATDEIAMRALERIDVEAMAVDAMAILQTAKV